MFIYYWNDVIKSKIGIVFLNVLFNKMFIECVVIFSSVFKMLFYFWERLMECIVEDEEKGFFLDLFESKFNCFVIVIKGRNE